MEKLSDKIINEKINSFIAWHTKNYAIRPFDEALDKVRFSLTERQFWAIEKDYNLKHFKKNYQYYGNFIFKKWSISFHYNDRMHCYEFRCITNNFIDDLDIEAREEYMDEKYPINN